MINQGIKDIKRCIIVRQQFYNPNSGVYEFKPHAISLENLNDFLINTDKPRGMLDYSCDNQYFYEADTTDDYNPTRIYFDIEYYVKHGKDFINTIFNEVYKIIKKELDINYEIPVVMYSNSINGHFTFKKKIEDKNRGSTICLYVTPRTAECEHR